MFVLRLFGYFREGSPICEARGLGAVGCSRLCWTKGISYFFMSGVRCKVLERLPFWLLGLLITFAFCNRGVSRVLRMDRMIWWVPCLSGL